MKVTFRVAYIICVSFIYVPVGLSAPMSGEAMGNTNVTQIVSLITYEFRGRHFVCSTTYSNLVNAPRWEFENTDPPLSVKSALSAAEEYGRSLYPSNITFMPLKVVLQRWLGDIWFYDVQLEPSSPDRSGGFMQPFEVALLMDRTVCKREEEILDPFSHRYMPANKRVRPRKVVKGGFPLDKVEIRMLMDGACHCLKPRSLNNK